MEYWIPLLEEISEDNGRLSEIEEKAKR